MTLRTWIELDATAFNHNISQYKKVIGNRLLATVIKSNAYGHGLIEIGMLAQENASVHMLCVAALSEAVVLRKAGITKPILVLSTIDDDLATIANNNIHVAVFNRAMIDEINRIGQRYNAIIPVHLKIDTGLSRLGIAPAYADEFISYIREQSHSSLVGIYSHFAESSNSDLSYTHEQAARFAKIITALEEVPPYIHMANSAGATALDLSFCTMVRIGCGIYGAWPSQANKKVTIEQHPDFTLKPILCWKTRISYINIVPAGTPIGYDRTFTATRPTKVATLPVGYYDGYDFKLFNQSSVLIRGAYAPIIGRISMNIMTIDITDIIDAQEGDEVTLIGSQPPIDAYSLGMQAGNPNVREVLTKINANIVRKIVHSLDLSEEKMKGRYVHP